MRVVAVRSWLLASVKVFVAFVFFGVAGAFLASYTGVWDTPVAGFCAAFGVVVTAFLAAPQLKLATATASFIVGAAVAWWLVGDSFWPEGLPKAYQPTNVPFYCTVAGGAFALLWCAIFRLAAPHRAAV